MAQVFRSKYGFHPCDINLYRKLCVLNKLTYEAEVQFAEWERWNRKQPQNRVIRKKIRNPAGQVVGWSVEGRREEPKVSSIFCRKSVGVDGRDYYELNIWLINVIRNSKKRAQHPKVSEDRVWPLLISEQKIDGLYFAVHHG